MLKKGEISSRLRGVLIDGLAEDGERIMNECLAEKEYNDDTFNLRASYGWGVYFHGKFVKVGYSNSVSSRSKKWYGEEITGDQLVVDFFEEGAFQPPSSSNSMGLIIVAAMPYGEPLENGHNFAHRKFKVVSMSYDKLKEMQQKYGGASVRTILRSKIV